MMKYRALKDELRLLAAQEEFVLGDKLIAVFEIPVASSWSKKKKALL